MPQLLLYGTKITEETRKKMSNTKKGKRTWNKGIPRTTEERRKISESKKGVKISPFTDEHKAKLTAAALLREQRKRNQQQQKYANLYEWEL